MNTKNIFKDAFYTRDIEEFLDLIFPHDWKPISARIIESGATFSNDMCDWAPRWSKIPPTIRYGNNELQTYVKSCIFRAHDCLHQLWGLPLPDADFSLDSFYKYKRSQMCGEVAVLTLTEFEFVDKISKQYPELSQFLYTRNALPIKYKVLYNKNIKQIAARLDGLLHKKIRPKWVRDNKEATDFCNDYVPMLQHDRDCIDHNWSLMKTNNWRPLDIPNARYSSNQDGLELTTWMINDFFHLLDTDETIDVALTNFNKSRRENIILPKTWNKI